jgi:hypothetical protein
LECVPYPLETDAVRFVEELEVSQGVALG